jgi:hypothetical protein
LFALVAFAARALAVAVVACTGSVAGTEDAGGARRAGGSRTSSHHRARASRVANTATLAADAGVAARLAAGLLHPIVIDVGADQRLDAAVAVEAVAAGARHGVRWGSSANRNNAVDPIAVEALRYAIGVTDGRHVDAIIAAGRSIAGQQAARWT